MGQRHQVYFITKTVLQDKTIDYNCIGAYHLQNLYGMNATVNAHRVIKLINENEYFRPDSRVIHTVATAIYGVGFSDNYLSMVHDECEYLIDDTGHALPEQGDNNDGCTLFLIEGKTVKVCFFTPGYCEGSYYDDTQWKTYTPKKYLSFYYNKKEQNEFDYHQQFKKHLDFIKDNPVKNITQKEFNIIFDNNMNKQKKAV